MVDGPSSALMDENVEIRSPLHKNDQIFSLGRTKKKSVQMTIMFKRRSNSRSSGSLLNDSRYYQDADIVRITEHLYLSSARPVCERNLKKHGITSVISICDMPSINLGDHIDHLKIVDVIDSPTAPLSLHFDSLADKIEASKKKNRRTLVHCFAGISRSATICMVYLMKFQNLTLKQAYQRVKSCRKEIRPNVGFFKQMMEFEMQLYGKNTVNMIPNPCAPRIGISGRTVFEGPEEIPDLYKQYYEPGRFQEIMHLRLLNFLSRTRGSPNPTPTASNSNSNPTGSDSPSAGATSASAPVASTTPKSGSNSAAAAAAATGVSANPNTPVFTCGDGRPKKRSSSTPRFARLFGRSSGFQS